MSESPSGPSTTPSSRAARRLGLTLSVCLLLPAQGLGSREPDPIVYTVRFDREAHAAQIEARVPTGGAATIEMMLPTWTPGYYVVEDFASRVEEISALLPNGEPGVVEKTRPNRWRFSTGGASEIAVRYRLRCDEASVSLNWVGESYALLNGSGTWLGLVGQEERPHHVRVVLPAPWTDTVSGLREGPGPEPHQFQANDYFELVDSPILAGGLNVSTFQVGSSTHVLASAGDDSALDRERLSDELRRVGIATDRLLGHQPFPRYAFLLVFREGGGGLEHRSSTMVTANPERTGTPEGHQALLGLISHEYVHTWNGKNLRPVELLRPDLETPPQITTLWFTEGATSYITSLVLRGAGLRGDEELLASVSQQIARLQGSPGRLRQTVEESSAEVWNNSLSGIHPSEEKVSYYDKGYVLAFLLDAKIRRSSEGKRSFGDFMRYAFQRYGGGNHGFTTDTLRSTAEAVAGGVDLGEWFRRGIASTEELDYSEALDWLGLRFAGPAGSPREWHLEPLPDASPEQRQRLADWLNVDR